MCTNVCHVCANVCNESVLMYVMCVPMRHECVPIYVMCVPMYMMTKCLERCHKTVERGGEDDMMEGESEAELDTFAKKSEFDIVARFVNNEQNFTFVPTAYLHTAQTCFMQTESNTRASSVRPLRTDAHPTQVSSKQHQTADLQLRSGQRPRPVSSYVSRRGIMHLGRGHAKSADILRSADRLPASAFM